MLMRMCELAVILRFFHCQYFLSIFVTLCVQTELYEARQHGTLSASSLGAVPDVYVRCQQLEAETKQLKEEMDKQQHVVEYVSNGLAFLCFPLSVVYLPFLCLLYPIVSSCLRGSFSSMFV